MWYQRIYPHVSETSMESDGYLMARTTLKTISNLSWCVWACVCVCVFYVVVCTCEVNIFMWRVIYSCGCFNNCTPLYLLRKGLSLILEIPFLVKSCKLVCFRELLFLSCGAKITCTWHTFWLLYRCSVSKLWSSYSCKLFVHSTIFPSMNSIIFSVHKITI